MNKQIFALTGALFLCNFLASCASPSTIAGGSIEVTNGYIVGITVAKDGTPSAGTVVSFVPKEWEGKISQLPDSLKDTTGSDGKFSIISHETFGTLFAENGSNKTAGIMAGTFESTTTLQVVPRTTVSMKIIGGGRIMEGTVQIMGSKISQSIHRGDSLVEFADVPVGSVRGVSWTPADSPSVTYKIYPEFQIRETAKTEIITGGAGRWFNPPVALNYDTIFVIARDSRGSIWIGSNGKGLYKSTDISSPNWKECAAQTADLKTVRSLSVDHDTIYALGVAQVHRSTDGATFTPVAIPSGSGSPIAIASGNGTIVAIWSDKAIWKNSAGTVRTFTGSSPFTSVCYAGNDQFVLGTSGSGILTVTPTDSIPASMATGFPSDTIRAITASRSGELAILCSEGIAVKRSVWSLTKFSDQSLNSLDTPRTIQFDKLGGVWCGGYNSMAISDLKIPFASMQNTPGPTRPYPDLFSSCEGFHGGVLFGGIGGILMMP